MTSKCILLLLGVCCLFACASARGAMMAGGLGDSMRVDDDASKAALAVRSAGERKLKSMNTMTSEWTPLTYAKQIVAGTNYFVKIRIWSRPAKYIHARIFQGLDGKTSLAGIETGHTATDPIKYFDGNMN